MSVPSQQAQAAAGVDPMRFRAAVGRWLRQNTQAAIVAAAMGALFGYAVNVLLTHVVFRGPGAFDGSSGVFLSLVRSALFCGICSTVVFGLIGYRLAVGKERFGQALRDAPGNIARLFRRDGKHARVHLLWGAAVGFVLMQFVTPLLGAAVAIGLVAGLPSIVGRVLANLLARVFSSAARALGPTQAIPLEHSLAMAVGMIGSAVALVAGLVVGGAGVKLALAATCAVAAILLAKGAPPASGTKVLVLIGASAWLAQMMFDPALALAQSRPVPGEMGMGCALKDCGEAHHGSLWLCGLIGGIFAGFAAPWGLGIGRVAGESGDGWGDAGSVAEPPVVVPPPPPAPPARPPAPARTAAPPSPPAESPTESPAAARVPIATLDQAADLPDLPITTDLPVSPRQDMTVLRNEDGEPVRIRRLPGTDLPSDLPEPPPVDVAPAKPRVGDMVRSASGLIDKVEDPDRQQFLRDFLNRHARPDGAGGFEGDPAAIEQATRAIRDQTFGADQQRQVGEAEEAQGESDAQRDSERFTERVRDWSGRINRGLAHFDPSGTGHKILKAQQGLYDAVKGYDEDGLRGAIGRTAGNALDEYAQGVGTTIYEGSLTGASAGEMAMDYARRRRAKIDPTLAAAQIGDAAGRLAEGEGIDAVGDLVDAGQNLVDLGQQLRNRARKRAQPDEEGDQPLVGTAGGGSLYERRQQAKKPPDQNDPSIRKIFEDEPDRPNNPFPIPTEPPNARRNAKTGMDADQRSSVDPFPEPAEPPGARQRAQDAVAEDARRRSRQFDPDKLPWNQDGPEPSERVKEKAAKWREGEVPGRIPADAPLRGRADRSLLEEDPPGPRPQPSARLPIHDVFKDVDKDRRSSYLFPPEPSGTPLVETDLNKVRPTARIPEPSDYVGPGLPTRDDPGGRYPFPIPPEPEFGRDHARAGTEADKRPNVTPFPLPPEEPDFPDNARRGAAEDAEAGPPVLPLKDWDDPGPAASKKVKRDADRYREGEVPGNRIPPEIPGRGRADPSLVDGPAPSEKVKQDAQRYREGDAAYDPKQLPPDFWPQPPGERGRPLRPDEQGPGVLTKEDPGFQGVGGHGRDTRMVKSTDDPNRWVEGEPKSSRVAAERIQQLESEVASLRGELASAQQTPAERGAQKSRSSTEAAIPASSSAESRQSATPPVPTVEIEVPEARTPPNPQAMAQMANRINTGAGDNDHYNALPGLGGEHAGYQLGGNPNNPTGEVRRDPFQTNSGKVITDPTEAALARHAQAKPYDTPFKSFTATEEKARQFNRDHVAQVDMPAAELQRRMQQGEAGRVPYEKMGDEKLMTEREFAMKNAPPENWKVISGESQSGMRLKTEQNGPLEGYQYYETAQGKVYRMYRGLSDHDIQ